MNILKVVRLGREISTGLVIKILLETKPGVMEHSIHILFNGSIKEHSHIDVAEGYREWDIVTGKPTSWKVVGAGQSQKQHSIPYKRGVRIVEGKKRKSWK